MADTVYHARFISEDTNPWDANESYGIWRHLEDAQDKAFEGTFGPPDEGNVISWVKTDGTYTGNGIVTTWVRVEHPANEEAGDSGDGYGMYIFEEELR